MNNSDKIKETKSLPKESGLYPHLKDGVAKAFTLSDEKRMQLFEHPMWIGYPRAKELLAKLEDLLESPPRHRPPGMLIVGNTNNGKTAIAQRFLSLHPPQDNPEGNEKIIPVIYIPCPSKPEEKRIIEELIAVVGGVIPDTSSVGALERSLVTTYAKNKVRLIIIDEIHNVLVGGPAQQRLFLTVIKGLSNRMQIPIVLVGTQLALHMLATDDQVANRFPAEPVPKWERGDDFGNLLASCERLLPLKKPSGLSKTALSDLILERTDGLIGEMFKLFEVVGKAAIKNKSEQITADLIHSVGWLSPSERKKVKV